MDNLQLLNENEIAPLLQILETQLPDSSVIYNWIKTQLEWRKTLKEIRLEIFCPKERFNSGSVIGLCYNLALEDSVIGVFYCSSQEDEKEFTQAVLHSAKIPWSKLNFIYEIPDKNLQLLDNILKLKSEKDIQFIPLQLHYLDADVAKAYPIPEIPPNVKLKPLESNNLDDVCNNWPRYDKRLRKVVENDINLNYTCGVYVTEENGQEVLAAMALHTDYGGIGLLQTVPKYRRLGYASLALAKLTRIMGEAGISPHFHVLSENIGALKMLEKTPYEIKCKTHWILLTDK